MFEAEHVSQSVHSQQIKSVSNLSNTNLNDFVISLNHRLNCLQNNFNSKIDRSECMLLLENKVSYQHLKKTMDEIQVQLDQQKRDNEIKTLQLKKQSNECVQKLMKKLGVRGQQSKKRKNNMGTENSFHMVKPQELYLQSNETMFSLVIQEISGLKQAQASYEKAVKEKNKTIINLHNEVCNKIENLQKQIQLNAKCITRLQKGSESSWFTEDRPKHFQMRNSKTEYSPSQDLQGSEMPDQARIVHLVRKLQDLQKQLAHKINIKDVLPLVKKNVSSLSQQIQDIKNYSEEGMESTKKILMHQSQINQELCLVSKLGWWQSFEEKEGCAVWSKELVNMIPEVLGYENNSEFITLVQQGLYIVKVLTASEESPEFILLNEDEHDIDTETLIRVEANTIIRVPSSGQQMVLCIQKL